MSSKFFTFALHFALPVAVDATIDARLVDSQGSLSSVGLLQVSTDAGGFGSVCNANPASADAPWLPNFLWTTLPRSCQVPVALLIAILDRGHLPLDGFRQRHCQRCPMQLLRRS